jgi:hypothetical protein
MILSFIRFHVNYGRLSYDKLTFVVCWALIMFVDVEKYCKKYYKKNKNL